MQTFLLLLYNSPSAMSASCQSELTSVARVRVRDPHDAILRFVRRPSSFRSRRRVFYSPHRMHHHRSDVEVAVVGRIDCKLTHSLTHSLGKRAVKGSRPGGGREHGKKVVYDLPGFRVK